MGARYTIFRTVTAAGCDLIRQIDIRRQSDIDQFYYYGEIMSQHSMTLCGQNG